MLDALDGHALRLQQVEHDAGVKIAATGAHRKAGQCRESHRSLDASSAAHGAHRGAITKMRDDNALMVHINSAAAERIDDVFVGQPMEAKPPNALCIERSWQSGESREAREIVMERRVETGDLRKTRPCFADGRDPGEIVRLV